MSTEDDYQWLFRKAPVMASAIAEDGVYLDVNDTMLKRLGYRRDEMVGRRPEEFTTPESAERVRTELRPALRRTGKIDNKPVSLVAKSGGVVDCVTSAIIEFDREGDFLRTIAMYTESSDLARANFKYRTLYRATPAMLHTVDNEGHLVTVTDHWLQKLGYQRDEVIGRPITDFFSQADRRLYANGKVKELIRQGAFTNMKRQMVTRSGSVIDLVSSAVVYRDEKGNFDHMLVASKDVTERNRAERALKQALAENARLSSRGG